MRIEFGGHYQITVYSLPRPARNYKKNLTSAMEGVTMVFGTLGASSSETRSDRCHLFEVSSAPHSLNE